MDLQAVITELSDQLDTITGLNCYPFPADRVVAPAALWWPEDIQFDMTAGRGSDRLTLSLWVATGRVVDESAWAALGAYCDGSGSSSVKAVLEAGTYDEFDSVRVTRCEFGELTVANTPHIAAMFTVDILGGGS